MKEKGAILLIEPELIVSMEIKMELESEGYTVIQSNTGKIKNETENTARLKGIIVDIEKTDWEDFTDLLEIPHFSALPVIAISSGNQAKNEYRGVKLAGTIFKPFNSKHLVSLVDDVLVA